MSSAPLVGPRGDRPRRRGGPLRCLPDTSGIHPAVFAVRRANARSARPTTITPPSTRRRGARARCSGSACHARSSVRPSRSSSIHRCRDRRDGHRRTRGRRSERRRRAGYIAPPDRPARRTRRCAGLAWIIHENIYRNGLAADGGFRRPQSPLWVPKSVLEPIQRPKRMNMQLDVAELIRQKCS